MANENEVKTGSLVYLCGRVKAVTQWPNCLNALVELLDGEMQPTGRVVNVRADLVLDPDTVLG